MGADQIHQSINPAQNQEPVVKRTWADKFKDKTPNPQKAKSLLHDYISLKRMERDIIKQRVKIQKIELDDCCSKYFYATSKARKEESLSSSTTILPKGLVVAYCNYTCLYIKFDIVNEMTFIIIIY